MKQMDQECEEPKIKTKKSKKHVVDDQHYDTTGGQLSEGKSHKKKNKNNEKKAIEQNMQAEEPVEHITKNNKSKEESGMVQKKMSDSDRIKAIEMLESGMTQLNVASCFGVAPSSISRLHRQYVATGSVERKKSNFEGKKKVNGLDEVTNQQDNENIDPHLIEEQVKSSKAEKKNKATFSKAMEIEEQPAQTAESDDEHKMMQNIKNNQNNDYINWPQKDLVELFKRIKASLPENDTMAFSTRAEKLDWDSIAFGEYNGSHCKNTWMFIQKKQRRYRLLREVLADAIEWISKPSPPDAQPKSKKHHPEFPKRPSTSYMIYYLKKKDKIANENPGLDMMDLPKIIADKFKELPIEKKEKYAKLAILQKEAYEKKVEEFYEKHPTLRPQLKGNGRVAENKVVDAGPKKPNNPFTLFYLNQLQNVDPEIDKTTFKEKCKEEWKTLSDKKKLVWINWAEAEETKYQADLKNYLVQHPAYVPVHQVRSVLTKEEKMIKERMSGKPAKPPSSAYSFFSQRMLQSEEVKKVHPKERMNVIATIWKKTTEEQKKKYKDQVVHLMEQYKLDFASYLETLPEDKRQEELLNLNNNNKRKKTAENGEGPSNKKKKSVKEAAEEVDTSIVKEETEDDIFKREPKQPPKSVFKYFLSKQSAKLQNDKKAAKEVWKKLTRPTQRKYEKELDNLKHGYLQEFEAFLKEMSKEQLTKYRDLKIDADNAQHSSESEENEEETKEEPMEEGAESNDD